MYFQLKSTKPLLLLKGILKKGWSSFEKDEVVEMVNFDKFSVIELFHGPTLAFKDIAMTILGLIMQYFLERHNKKVTVLVGTTSPNIKLN